MSSERLLLEEKSPWWGEHQHRYLEVLKELSGSEDVLDIACGTGYGTDILSKKCRSIIGGDINDEAIEMNSKLWNRPNIKFMTMDGTQLPFEDERFDVLVSFETIEHTTQYIQMLNEFNRVVKKGGRLYISTPNIYLNGKEGKVTNPYHTQEWTPNEFKEIISSIFSDFKLYGQEYIRYKDNNSFQLTLGYWVEKLFYLRGFRKIPISIQDKIMQLICGKNQYPDASDYRLTDDEKVIEGKCVTQMVVIKNK